MKITQGNMSLRRRTYLLSAWQEPDGSAPVGAVWRFSLEETRRPRRRLFATLKEVMAYVEQELTAFEPDAP